MTTNNNLDALSQDAELPFGHPGRRSDDTPEGFEPSPLVDVHRGRKSQITHVRINLAGGQSSSPLPTNCSGPAFAAQDCSGLSSGGAAGPGKTCFLLMAAVQYVQQSGRPSSTSR